MSLRISISYILQLQTHPTTPTEHASGSKILFVGNLSFSIEQEDVYVSCPESFVVAGMFYILTLL